MPNNSKPTHTNAKANQSPPLIEADDLKIPESQGDESDRAELEIENELQGQIDNVRRQLRETESRRLNSKKPSF